MKTKNIPAVTRAQMVEIDRLMIERYGITLLQMMENAGRDLADLAQIMLSGSVSGKRVAILCGGGNNGGGGMAATRHLINRGYIVQVALVVPEDSLKDTPALQLHTLKEMGAYISASFPTGEFDLVIDALIGYGLNGGPKGQIAEWIDKTNISGIPILSLDIPSGLDADSGQAPGACIHATTTLTLALPKVSMLREDAIDYVGDLYVGDISVPQKLLKEIGIDAPAIFSDSPVIKINHVNERNHG